jgi:hypothetical protein
MLFPAGVSEERGGKETGKQQLRRQRLKPSGCRKAKPTEGAGKKGKREKAKGERKIEECVEGGCGNFGNSGRRECCCNCGNER